ncbi:sodium channel modifier 1 isoform 2-T2 [Passerculus sandwichensis]
MSFKRDESDPGPLGALQRRRVAELLASAIPEDEALLLRDGRLACSLCPQRPVCDTLQTLLLHRAGRKHLDNLLRSFGRPRCPQVTPEGPQVTPQEAPGPAADPNAPPGPERSADNGPVQQLLQERQDQGQQLPGRDARGDPKEFPGAARAVTEPRERRERRECRKPRAQRGRCRGRRAGKERELPKPQGGAEPRAAADPAAPPAPAQPGLAPGSRWELGQGQQRRVRLRRGGAATAATSLTPPGVPRRPQVSPGVPRAPGIKWEFFWERFCTIFPLYSQRFLSSGGF